MMRFPVRRPQFLLFTSPAIQSGRRFMQARMLKDCEGGPRVDEFLYVAIFAPAFFQVAPDSDMDERQNMAV